MSSIVIRQHRDSTTRHRVEPPKWKYIIPSPQLEQQGLTPHKLTEIIDSLNQMAEDIVNLHIIANGYGRIFTLIPFYGFIIGLFSTHKSAFDRVSICSISTVIMMLLSQWIRWTDHIAIRNAQKTIKREIEGKLNEEWKHNQDIRWDVVMESTGSVHHDNYGRSTTQKICYYDIAVQALNASNASIVPLHVSHVTPSKVEEKEISKTFRPGMGSHGGKRHLDPWSLSFYGIALRLYQISIRSYYNSINQQ